MKIALLCVKSISVVWFRKTLIKELVKRGHDVTVVAFDRENEEEIKSYGANFCLCDDSNRSINPLKILTLSKRYSKIIKEISPDLVFTFMLKPNLFGVLGAKKAGVDNIYSMVEGAGDVFIYNTLKWKLIRKFVCIMYKKAFKHSKKVFFLNTDDQADFINRGLVKEEQCEIIHGIGVDLERFAYEPVVNHSSFLMIARMLKTKGIMEYCEAAKEVKKIYPNAEFNYLGSEGTVKIEDLKEYIDAGIINHLGVTSDVRPFIKNSAVNVLPSYREGLGLVNAEAGAIGRPSITCDTIGTRDTVIDGYNGFLVPVGDSHALAEKMIYFLEHPDAVESMGVNARNFSEKMFDYKVINDKICAVIGAKQEETQK